MNKFLLSILLFASSTLFANPWPKISQEQRQYEALSLECNRIVENFAGMGCSLRSPSIANAIYQYLKDVNTEVSYKVLLDQIKSGRVPEYYLNKK